MEALTRSSFRSADAGRYLGSIFACALAVAGTAQADVIADFNEIGARTATPPAGAMYAAVTPQEKRTLSFVDLATMHLAMYDAVVAIEGGFEPYAIVPTSPTAGASAAAAAAAAACAVLQGMFPNRAAQYEADCAPYQGVSGTETATAKGIALGIEVGQKMLLERADDGRDTSENYSPGGEIGDFVPAAPGNPVWHFAPYMRAFTLSSPAQFRADGPPALTSASYAEAFSEVKKFGQAGGTALSPAQQEAARFHTENPNLFWPRATRVFMNQSSLLENARLAAMLQVSIGDSILGCFDSKYYFDAWRPRTAIAAAATDGNPATHADSNWLPLAASPNHPEYPSGHSCIAGAVGEVVKSHYGTPKVAFAWTGTATGTTHAYESIHEMLREIKSARVHGGMHFRFSNDDGVTLGRRTADWVGRNYFRPVGRR